MNNTIKRICILLFFVLVFGTVQAQIPVYTTVPSAFPDWLSEQSYTKIRNHHTTMSGYAATNATAVKTFTDIIKKQLKDLKTVSYALQSQRLPVENFILSSSFSSTLGYNSYGYIKKKYPILALTPIDIFKNKVIRTRLYMRLKIERNRVQDYLDVSNPMPEGQRILLILTSLDKVINIALENETY